MQWKRGECENLSLKPEHIYSKDWKTTWVLSFLQICNQNNECHCDPGWAPPYCDVQYSQLASSKHIIKHQSCVSEAVVICSFHLNVFLWNVSGRVRNVGFSVAAAVVVLLLVFAGFGVFHYKRRKAIRQRTWVDWTHLSTSNFLLTVKLYFAFCLCVNSEDYSSGQMNLLHDDRAVRRNPPHISEPTFIESSATLRTATARPTRAAPPPVTTTSHTHTVHLLYL